MLKMESNKTFMLSGIRWNVLDKLESGYLCIADSIGDRKFGGNNDWGKSVIRKELEELAEKLEKELGITLPEFERDLLSMDGQTEYGKCKDKMSLITVDEYRKYRSKLPNAGKWWWTITPDSTPCNNDSLWLRVVAPSGVISDCDCYFNYGVRPICIFPSLIFESKED